MSDHSAPDAGATLITDVLGRRAAAVTGSPITFDDIAGRVRTIRRRRRAAVAGAVAAVAAIVVPVVLLLGATQDRGQDVPPVVPPTPPVTQGLPYLTDGSVVLPDGSTIETGYTMREIEAFTVLSDDRVVLAVSQRNAEDTFVAVLPADGGEPVQYAVTTLGLKSDPQRSLVAWVADDGRPQVLETGVDEPVALAALPTTEQSVPRIAGVAGSDCASGGCRVWVSVEDGVNVVVDTDAVTDVPGPAGLALSDVYAPDGEAVALAGDERPTVDGDQYGCAVLLDPDGAVTARSCETSFLQFSPDGEILRGARGDGGGFNTVELFDTDLAQIGVLEPADGAISQVDFDVDDTLLAVQFRYREQDDGVEWTVVRYPATPGTTSGAPAPVAGPLQGTEFPALFKIPL